MTDRGDDGRRCSRPSPSPPLPSPSPCRETTKINARDLLVTTHFMSGPWHPLYASLDDDAKAEDVLTTVRAYEATFAWGTAATDWLLIRSLFCATPDIAQAVCSHFSQSAAGAINDIQTRQSVYVDPGWEAVVHHGRNTLFFNRRLCLSPSVLRWLVDAEFFSANEARVLVCAHGSLEQVTRLVAVADGALIVTAVAHGNMDAVQHLWYLAPKKDLWHSSQLWRDGLADHLLMTKDVDRASVVTMRALLDFMTNVVGVEIEEEEDDLKTWRETDRFERRAGWLTAVATVAAAPRPLSPPPKIVKRQK